MNVIEKGINFKIDAELYKKIKIRVAENEITLKDYIIGLIKKDLDEK